MCAFGIGNGITGAVERGFATVVVVVGEEMISMVFYMSWLLLLLLQRCDLVYDDTRTSKIHLIR
jgi:hypothetical protein